MKTGSKIVGMFCAVLLVVSYFSTVEEASKIFAQSPEQPTVNVAPLGTTKSRIVSKTCDEDGCTTYSERQVLRSYSPVRNTVSSTRTVVHQSGTLARNVVRRSVAPVRGFVGRLFKGHCCR